MSGDTRETVIQLIAGVLRLDEPDVAILRMETGYKQLRKWTSARRSPRVSR